MASGSPSGEVHSLRVAAYMDATSAAVSLGGAGHDMSSLFVVRTCTRIGPIVPGILGPLATNQGPPGTSSAGTSLGGRSLELGFETGGYEASVVEL